jgi:uncharacterized radical SAM protein YgiQ
MTNSTFLPASADDMKALEWDQADIIIVSGDAYVDHPSFGTAVMARLGEYCGLKVAVLPQPNWRDDLRDFKKLGKPKYFFGVTAGCMDSMVNHYTARKRLRSDDAYTPGGRAGFRPDYAATVYSSILKSLYPDTPVILGGIEASLRRLTHYDFWTESLKPSILVDSQADMILYGMAERAFVALIEELKKGVLFKDITHIPQTAFLQKQIQRHPDDIILPSHEACLNSKKVFAEAFKITEQESNTIHAKRIIQPYKDVFAVINPPFLPPTPEETDLSFDLPYTRLPHPRYRNKPPIPAFEMIRNSVTIHRGCFGGCSFCAISSHQGKFIASRSEASVLHEIQMIASQPDFKGHITDLGGPSANMYNMQGIDLQLCEKCYRPSCIFPAICKNLNFDHNPMIQLYNKIRAIEGIRKVTIGSGIRYDMLVEQNPLTDKKYALTEYATLLITKHVSGRLKVAPEHVAESVLNIMRKPSFEKFRTFNRLFHKLNREKNLKQELKLYLIAGHPGSSDTDTELLSSTMMSMGHQVESVQEFTPTPMTLSSVIYYSGLNPYTGKTVLVPKSGKDIRRQKNIIQKNRRNPRF